METKYSILTKLLKNLKTSVLPSGTAANAGNEGSQLDGTVY